MIEVELVSLIKNSELMASLCGRVYPELLPQEVDYPALTYQEVSLFDDFNYDSDSRIDKARFQFDIYSQSYAEVRELSRALHNLLKDYTSARIISIRRLNRNDLGELDGDKYFRRVSIDYYITYLDI